MKGESLITKHRQLLMVSAIVMFLLIVFGVFAYIFLTIVDAARATMILTAFVLVASCGILLAAIVAALFAAPPFLRFMDSLSPPIFAFSQIQITDEHGNILLDDWGQKLGTDWKPSPFLWTVPPVQARPNGAGDSTLRMYVRFRNEGKQAASWLGNFVMPKDCTPKVLDELPKGHYLNPGFIYSKNLLDDEEIPAWLSACKGEIPPGFTSALAMEVQILKDRRPPTDDSWPIVVQVGPFLSDHYDPDFPVFELRLLIQVPSQTTPVLPSP